jgi:hypothetical protein
MTGGINIEERFEQMSRRLERAEQANRAMKIWSSIAFAVLIAFGSGPFASTVLAKKKPPAKIQAQEIDLVTSTGQTVATLREVSGEPNLVFLDGSGKPVLGVGIASAVSAGIAVFDGNSVLPGAGKIRNTWGVTASGPVAGIGGVTFDSTGALRTRWGDAVDGSSSGVSLFDASGGFRTGIQYDPTTAFFNGFVSQDGSGHNLSVLGNVLATNGILAPNDSFMDLFDTTGQIRLFEYQNSTKEGGLVFDPAAGTTSEGSWGDP